jgi:hypothetical protein
MQIPTLSDLISASQYSIEDVIFLASQSLVFFLFRCHRDPTLNLSTSLPHGHMSDEIRNSSGRSSTILPTSHIRLDEKSLENASDNIDSSEGLSPELELPTRDECPTTMEYIYPEGGLQAWLVVLGSWCALFAALGVANTLAIFQAYISQDQLSSYDPSQIS